MITERQAQYAGSHGGRYWQGLWSNVALPEHDATTEGDTEPDNLASHPHDQADTWLDLFPELAGTPVPAALWIDAYLAPEGYGFIANVALKYKGTIYHRAKNVGPLDQHTIDWHIIDPAELAARLGQ